eukprot:2558832-Amphidinium_carterae.1
MVWRPLSGSAPVKLLFIVLKKIRLIPNMPLSFFTRVSDCGEGRGHLYKPVCILTTKFYHHTATKLSRMCRLHTLFGWGGRHFENHMRCTWFQIWGCSCFQQMTDKQVSAALAA